MLKMKVDGMTCGHCVQHVTKAIEALASVDRVSVDLDAGEVTIDGGVDERSVRLAITEAGYEVR